MARAIKRKLDNGDFVRREESFVTTDERIRSRIAERAYWLYEQRGCVHGHDAEDWLEAERLVLAELAAQPRKSPRSPGRRKSMKAEEQ
jgi:hypothetical protein